MMRSGYGPDDMMPGYPDNFVNTYVGHVYENSNIPGSGIEQMSETFNDYVRVEQGKPRKWKYETFATESISVGVEYFIDPVARAELYARDQDHFNLILSLTKELLD